MQNINNLIAAAGPSPSTVEGGTSSPEAMKALAAQFEAMLLGQMLRQMRSSMFDDEEDKSAGFGDGPLFDTMYSELSLALSRAGGLGIGDSLLGPMMREASVDAPGIPAAPAPGIVSSRYGWRRDPVGGGEQFHNGVDIAMPTGTEVAAMRAGRVTFAGERAGYGLTVEIAHEGGLTTRYAHLSALTAEPGQDVAQGAVIARSGATGRATGPHLHFEVLDGGRPVDPGVLSAFPATRAPGSSD